MTTCGAAIPTLLRQNGVNCVFGIPGNHTLELYRGLEDSNIRHITTRHEQGAGFMADGYARVTRQPGVCFLISGPGLLNAATPIAQAAADSIPMLVITSINTPSDETGRLHELPDQTATALSLFRHSFTVAKPEQLQPLLHQAFSYLQHERPGPIHLQIPVDVLAMPYDLSEQVSQPTSPTVDREINNLVQQAAALLQTAQRPLILAGGGAIDAAVVTLAERLDTPVLNTTNAKGLLSPTHPLFVGGSPSLPSLQYELSQCDVVLAVGTEFGETDYDLLMTGPPQLPGQLVRVDIDSAQVHRNHQPDIALTGDAVNVVAALSSLIEPQKRNGDSRAQLLRAGVKAEPHYHKDFATFFDAVKNAAPKLTLVGDSTRPTYYATWMYECDKPRQYFHSVSGFGTLGYAIPAAFGAKLALGHEPVVALIGDGGAQFSLTELATAVDNKLCVPIIIWCNNGYEEITHSLEARNIDTVSTQVSAPDFEKIAAAYGCKCFRPSTPEALTEAIRLTVTYDRPSLILVSQDNFVHQPSGEWYA